MRSDDRHGGPGQRLGPTRLRDLLVVTLVAAAIAYAVTRWNYSSLPRLPRLAGVTAALLGIGEAVAGWGLRQRIQRGADEHGRPALPPLVAARALAVAKASTLAGAAFAGLWLGFAAYVLPDSSVATVAAADLVTAIIGLACSVALVLGAYYLEFCCRAPQNRA